MRNVLFQNEPVGTPLTTLQATEQARQPTQRSRSVTIAYCVIIPPLLLEVIRMDASSADFP